MDWDEVRTERLLLRRPTSDDLDAAFEVHSAPETNRFNPDGPDADRDASARRLEEWIAHWERHGFGYWAIEPAGSADVIGFSGLRHGTWSTVAILNLYYRFSAASWGHGYAREAAGTAVRLAQERFPGLPVVARTTVDNIPSQRTAAFVGLKRRPDLDRFVDGVHEVILVSSWPAPPPPGGRS